MPFDPLPARLVTLADVVIAIDADPALTPARRRDLSAAVRFMAKALGGVPETLPAALNQVRPRINALRPEPLGLAPKTLANLRSNFMAALRATGATRLKGPPLTPDWEAARRLLPDKGFKNGLSRFLGFCSAARLAPDDVDDATVTAFVASLDADTLVDDVHARHRRTCQLWNEAAGSIPGWPNRRLALPNYRKPRRSRAIADLPPSFRNEAEAYLTTMADGDLDDEEAPAAPCAPGTIRLQRRLIELAATALMNSGVALQDLTGLSLLVERANAKAILSAYRNGERFRPTAFSLHRMIMRIARRHVKLSEEHLKRLRALGTIMAKDAPTGLTEKNRRMLAQFRDERVLDRWLFMPERQAAAALDPALSPQRAAVAMQLALVVDLLQRAPMRLQNLISLRLDQHIVRPGGIGTRFVLFVPAHEVKNRQPLEFRISQEGSDLLDLYLLRFRPALAGPDNPFLFPSLASDQKAQSTLAQQIGEAVLRWAGVRMTAHQFRHLAAALLLRADPGGVDVVRRLLGHKDLRTTLAYYAELNVQAAADIYDDVLQRRRQEARDRRPAMPGSSRRSGRRSG